MILQGNTITQFKGRYSFLSNFYVSEMTMPDGIIYPTAEHAYQAQKTADMGLRKELAKVPSPGLAKKVGRTLILVADWDRLAVMERVLITKFAILHLQAALLSTGDRYLVEGNYWKDYYWGICQGKGENHLGLLLMKVRDFYGKNVQTHAV